MKFPGGKGRSYQTYINLIPPHDLYIESHLGGGAILRQKSRAKHSIGIDINPEVAEMWRNMNQIDFELIHGDAIVFLKSHSFTGKEFVYCDPPYLRETRKKHYPLYKYEYSSEQHMELLEVLKSIPCMVMISGYDSQLYTDSLKTWHSKSFQTVTQRGLVTEWIWMNYPPPVELHDYRYLGNTFRERYRIKNISKRFVAKFQSMPVLERNAILAAIHANDVEI